AESHIQELRRIDGRTAALAPKDFEVRRLLDWCLLIPRYRQAQGDPNAAGEEAARCVSEFVGAEPSDVFHPPSVRQLWSRAWQALQSERSARLRVETDRSGCHAKINGVVAGSVPLTVGRLTPGAVYVRLVCDDGRESKVYRSELQSGENWLKVSFSLEKSLRMRPQVHLAYSGLPEAADRVADHALQLAQWLGVEQFALLTHAGDEVFLEHVEVSTGQRSARIQLSKQQLREDPAEAVRLLLPAQTEVAQGSDRQPRWSTKHSRYMGISLLAVGTAALTTGFVSWGLRWSARRDGSIPENTGSSSVAAADSDRYEFIERWPYYWSPTGAAAAAAGSVLLLQSVGPVPHARRWGWLSLGTGVFLAATAASLWVHKLTNDADFERLDVPLASASIPFFALSYGFFRFAQDGDHEAEHRASVTTDRGMFLPQSVPGGVGLGYQRSF
ncbi:MAG: hypothetical protein AAF550_05700, partial [Myxococcota bacterium]